MESMCLRLQIIQRTVTGLGRSSMVKVNAGSVKVNQILLSSKKLAYTHHWNLIQRSWSLESRYRSSRGFGVRAEAASGFPVSYESSETYNKGEKMVGSNANGFVASQTGGPDIGDGDGHGGHGHEGNNGGGDSNNSNNNNSGGYGDSGHSDNNKLISTVWWLILQCIRMLRTTSTMWGNGRPDLVWLAVVERVFEFISVDLMMSGGLTSSLIAPSVLAVTEAAVMLFSGFLWFLTELETSLCVVMSMMLAGFVAVTAGFSWAVFALCSNCDIFQNSHDGKDDENDYSVE